MAGKPGFYLDENGSGAFRLWDGASWKDEVIPADARDEALLASILMCALRTEDLQQVSAQRLAWIQTWTAWIAIPVIVSLAIAVVVLVTK